MVFGEVPTRENGVGIPYDSEELLHGTDLLKCLVISAIMRIRHTHENNPKIAQPHLRAARHWMNVIVLIAMRKIAKSRRKRIIKLPPGSIRALSTNANKIRPGVTQRFQPLVPACQASLFGLKSRDRRDGHTIRYENSKDQRVHEVLLRLWNLLDRDRIPQRSARQISD